jgi:repressor LexA
VPEELSERQQDILDFIVETQEQGWTPSVREIGREVGLRSPAAVHKHLKAMETEGYIQRVPGKMRAIEVLQPVPGSVPRFSVPIVGEIAAGEPILAEQNLDGHLNLVDEDTARNGEPCFALRVQGESMIEAGILPGDYVIVRQQDVADNGDIVVALLDQEATVKYFHREEDHIRLQPANGSMAPVMVQDVRILGKVVSVFRSLL